jgi:hypothetical protein
MTDFLWKEEEACPHSAAFPAAPGWALSGQIPTGTCEQLPWGLVKVYDSHSQSNQCSDTNEPLDILIIGKDPSRVSQRPDCTAHAGGFPEVIARMRSVCLRKWTLKLCRGGEGKREKRNRNMSILRDRPFEVSAETKVGQPLTLHLHSRPAP